MIDYSQSFWGEPDSLVNWCEDDYVHFSFIAETYNSISNFYTIIIGFALFKHFNKLEVRFRVASLLMMLVGIGSMLFHGTLRYHYQLFDEIPMLYVCFAMTYIVLEMPNKVKRYPYLPLNITIISIVLTIGHIQLKNAELFFAAFGILL